MSNAPRDDRILPSTRILGGIVVPFLAAAFIILYLFPAQSGTRFAWSIKPNMTAMFMGAGYIGGSWLFLNAIVGRRWHRLAPGFPAVTAFTIAMLAATLLHWDRFDPHRFPFIVWLVLYVITPFLVPWAWLRNRETDSGAPEPDDAVVPAFVRRGLIALGAALLALALCGFLRPSWLIGIWPWKLTPLTARVLSGWFVLLGVGDVVFGLESRWSAWKVGVQSIAVWQVLVVAAAFLNPADFPRGLANWYLLSLMAVLAGVAILYVTMELQRRRKGPGAG